LFDAYGETEQLMLPNFYFSVAGNRTVSSWRPPYYRRLMIFFCW
jgi:hypothetical protein